MPWRGAVVQSLKVRQTAGAPMAARPARRRAGRGTTASCGRGRPMTHRRAHGVPGRRGPSHSCRYEYPEPTTARSGWPLCSSAGDRDLAGGTHEGVLGGCSRRTGGRTLAAGCAGCSTGSRRSRTPSRCRVRAAGVQEAVGLGEVGRLPVPSPPKAKGYAASRRDTGIPRRRARARTARRSNMPTGAPPRPADGTVSRIRSHAACAGTGCAPRSRRRSGPIAVDRASSSCSR
jgi:hypothetical protein